MKLLLINPHLGGVVYAPSLGLGFIGTYVKNNSDCEVELVEPLTKKININEVIQKAKYSDFVGLICYTENRFDCFSLAARIKKANPNCKILLGGAHVTQLDTKILEHYPFIDIIVRMEGEETTLNIIKNKKLKDIDGITYRSKKGKIIRNPDRIMCEDISKYYYDYNLNPQIWSWKDDV